MFLDENNLAAQSHDMEQDLHPENMVALEASTQHEARTFGLPGSVWSIMLTSYAIFFVALAIATGHDLGAIFVVTVSGLFAIMYFGTTFVLNSIGAAGRKELESEWVKGKFQSLNGPMSFGEIFGQMLILPILFAIFAVAVIFIRSAVM
ncbi:hypothetical protein [Parasphingorhabdus sp.]|uniref:hypothetical protein n=1 Tax=Parasphingorhabdus sp. TaxID=2709688 RepID=UPI002F95CCF6